MILERLIAEKGSSVNAVVVVAHPDDEALWFGGLIAAMPFQWTVIACSIPESDPIRAWKFYNACEILGVVGKVIPLQENKVGISVKAGALDILETELNAGGYDVIVTHGAAGAYGHNQHVHLNDFLTGTYPGMVVTECYGMPEGPFALSLDDTIWARKLAAIQAYDHYDVANGGRQKSEVLLAAFERQFDLRRETYDGPE